MTLTPFRNDDFKSGVVLNAEEFKIPDNAFFKMKNVFPWRNRIRMRYGNRFFGRLRRCLTEQALGDAPAAGTSYTFNIKTVLSLESNASIEPSSIEITIGGLITVEDQGDGTLDKTGGTADLDSATINYQTGAVVITITGAAFSSEEVTSDFCYFPNLPVMGIHQRELRAINDEQTIVFDTRYAYKYDPGSQKFEEFIAGTTWSGNNSDFFWATNFWQDASDNDLFWVTNFSGPTGDPIRYTNGSTWTNFTPAVNATTSLFQSLILVPFRGMMLALNTWEGATAGGLSGATNFPQRVRGSQIGNPIEADAWRDDIPGKGFFFDLPTNQAIVAIGFVRDDLVVFCERSSWLLSFTGNAVVPVVDQRENTDLGVASTYSVVNFDDNIVGIGDKYVVSSNAIDTRAINDDIPDFAFDIHNENNGRKRVHGIRDYNERLSYWTYPEFEEDTTFPGNILVWNYVDNTWSFFRDNITTFGVFNQNVDIKWEDVSWTWSEWTSTWSNGAKQSQYPEILGGNQHGFVMLMHRQLVDDVSMPILGITIASGQVQINIPNHNLRDREIIRISGILGNYSDLNNANYQVQAIDENNLLLFNLEANDVIVPTTHSTETYLGNGKVALKANFDLISKKFNFIEAGKKVFLAYVDLMLSVDDNAIFSLNIFQDYKNDNALNRDPFWFREIKPILTESDTPDQKKVFFKNYVGTIANFVQYQLTISDVNLLKDNSGMLFQMDSIVLHLRPTGKLTV